MKRAAGILSVLAALGAFAGWWITEKIEGLGRWRVGE